jgi:two-component system response regulator PilR (NtrC family)
MAALEAFAWPGNVRELENVIERAVTLEAGAVIRVDSLPDSVRGGQTQELYRIEFPPDGLDLDGLMERIERDLMRRALQRAGGIQSRAAQLLGTSFRSFRYRLQKYGMGEAVDQAGGAPTG